MPRTVIRARRLFDSCSPSGSHEHMAVVVENGRITDITQAQDLGSDLGDATVYDYEDGCLLPGFVDSHVHLMYGTAGRMGGPRSYHHVNDEDSDSLMLLRCVRNAYIHLLAGVTTMRDCGARNRVTFDFKAGLKADLFGLAPNVLVSGRSLTHTGGHFYFCGEEADGPDECRKAVRRLVKEGADFIKVMGSGGGTYITQPRLPGFTVEELKVIQDEARRNDKRTTIHVLATQSIVNAVEARFDCLEHVEFVEPDSSRQYHPEIARMIADSGCWVSPTIQTGFRGYERLSHKRESEGLMPGEEASYLALKAKQETNLHTCGELHRMGVRMIVGTDAIGDFGDYSPGPELMVKAGMSAGEVLVAATRHGAEALDLSDEVGTIERGKAADLVVVEGNPTTDIRAIRNVKQVFRRGTAVPMDASLLFYRGPGAIRGRRRLILPQPIQKALLDR
ncbi:MAG: amidohydrolase family protein [Bacillota bacterium]|nr:amidohydrolase family protein [Bacillota bacterium]